MGTTRLLLALFVVIHHSYPLFEYLHLSSTLAVRAFFVISGFYMTLILREKYIGPNNSYWLFLSNRLARIFPTYWLILVITLILSFFWFQKSSYSPFQSYQENNGSVSNFWVYITPQNVVHNFTIIGSVDYGQINERGKQILVVGQAWTLVIEILFYIVAPFIVKKLNILIPVFFLSIVCRYSVDHYTLIHHFPLTDRFFPAEIMYFLLGALSYYLYKRVKTININQIIVTSITIIFIVFTLAYGYLPIDHQIRWINLKDIYYILILPLAIPFIFLFTNKNSIDRFLGELSFPAYLSHTVIILVLSSNSGLTSNKSTFSVVTILMTILASVLILLFFERPIEKWRQGRLKTKTSIFVKPN